MSPKGPDLLGNPSWGCLTQFYFSLQKIRHPLLISEKKKKSPIFHIIAEWLPDSSRNGSPGFGCYVCLKSDFTGIVSFHRFYAQLQGVFPPFCARSVWLIKATSSVVLHRISLTCRPLSWCSWVYCKGTFKIALQNAVFFEPHWLNNNKNGPVHDEIGAI